MPSYSDRLDNTVSLVLQHKGEAVLSYTFEDFADANALLLQLQELLTAAQAKLTLLDAQVTVHSVEVQLNLRHDELPQG